MSTKILNNQSGIALIIFLTVVVLGTATFFLSGVNNSRFQREINSQKQTNKALRQAKEALLGFAAVYAETHSSNEPQGYLPCPDLDGDGSSDPSGSESEGLSCESKGKSVLGWFPWRTLGLPPLRDGNGDCLWYAVSGNYKDKAKSALTSDTPGLFIVENIKGNKIAGATTCTSSTCTSEDDAAKQTIAIIFAAGEALEGQSRIPTGAKTICSSKNTSVSTDNINNLDNINKAENYLDKFKVSAGYTIDNSKGVNESAATDDWGDEALPTENNSVFINAPLTYDTDGEIIFNDTLMLITRQDYEPIYERMDFWVAKQVRKCLVNVNNYLYEKRFLRESRTDGGFLEAIGDWENPVAGNYRAEDTPSHDVKTYIEDYVNAQIEHCEIKCDGKQNDCGTKCEDVPNCLDDCEGDTDCEQACVDVAACKTSCDDDNVTCKSATSGCNKIEKRDDYKKKSIFVEKRFPWAADINDPDCFNNIGYQDTSYKDICPPDNDNLFGRIPNIPNTATDKGMLTEWTDKCFNNFWWDKWKEKVFYAVSSDYASNTGGAVHFWVKAKRNWKANETWHDFKAREAKIKEDTFAKIKDDNKYDWEYVSPIPTISPTDILKVNDNEVDKFVIFVAGQRLNNQTRDNNAAKEDINNYLEDDNFSYFQYYLNNNKCPNSPQVCNFERKKTDKDFNDIVCKDNWNDCDIPK
ncbi:hypothetical protein QUF74_03950 [Candidatus Halobeggiatoa sp. HSG11]|nr:hypothetical protein [Candidatus Halobeggiatoa sp. HSG11]